MKSIHVGTSCYCRDLEPLVVASHFPLTIYFFRVNFSKKWLRDANFLLGGDIILSYFGNDTVLVFLCYWVIVLAPILASLPKVPVILLRRTNNVCIFLFPFNLTTNYNLLQIQSIGNKLIDIHN